MPTISFSLMRHQQSPITLFAASATKLILQMNLGKTIIMSYNKYHQLLSCHIKLLSCLHCNIDTATNSVKVFHIDGVPMSEVTSFIYLNSIMSTNCSSDDEITKRRSVTS